MKYMNLKKRYRALNLQFFAGADDKGSDGDDDAGDDDDQDDDDDDQDDADEKKFSQKDVDDAVKKRLAREKRKWQRQQQKKTAADKRDDDGVDTDSGDNGAGSENEKARKAAEDKASVLEMKVACFEAGVAKDAVADVAALAKAYMAEDEDLDLEDAIEKVVKKYPQFKKGAADPYDEEDKKSGSWGERQKGKGKKEVTGVEASFYELNPDLKN